MFMDWKTLYCYNIKTPRETYSFNVLSAAAAAKLLQSCPTLCDPIDGGPPGSPVPGILQARTLEWVASSFSNAWKWKVKVKSLSPVRLFATPWIAAYQAPPSMGFSRQEYWSGVHCLLRMYSLQIPITDSAKMENPILILKLLWNLMGLQIAKTILKKKKKEASRFLIPRLTRKLQ